MFEKEPIDYMHNPMVSPQERLIAKVAVLNFDNPEDVLKYEFLNNDKDVAVTSHTMSFDHKGTFRMVVFYSVPESKYNAHMKKLKSGDLEIKVSDTVEPKSETVSVRVTNNRVAKVRQLGWELTKNPGPSPTESEESSENSGIQDETGGDPVNNVMDKIMHETQSSREGQPGDDSNPA